MTRLALVAIICALPLAACSDVVQSEGTPAPHAGDAVKHNIAAQLVNPEAGDYSEPQSADGQRAALAQQRYTTGKTIKPEPISSSEQLSSGGTNDNGSGSGSSSSGP